MKKLKGDNRGLSLVELLVAIVVLGIICIPLITTFINSARINRNAQRVHSAATLAQSLMEEYKATNLSVLLQDVTPGSVSAGYYASLTPAEQEIVSGNEAAFIPYVFYRTGLTADNGHVYDARITLNPMPYSSFDLTVSNASNTNTAQIPSLPQVDAAKSAVIGAQSIAQDRKSTTGDDPVAKKIAAMLGEYPTASLGDVWDSTNGKVVWSSISDNIQKKITIIIDDDASSVPADTVLISCDVTYTYNNAALGSPFFTVSAFQGFYNIDTTGSDDPDDEDIPGRATAYLFWTPALYNYGNDTIIIQNKTSYRIDVYFVKQEIDPVARSGYEGNSRKIYVQDSAGVNTEFDPVAVPEHKDGRASIGNVNLITNLGTSKMYDNEATVRCYEVTVELFEGNGVDVYDESSTAQVTTMTSTKEVYQ